jgi:hypothetical protein
MAKGSAVSKKSILAAEPEDLPLALHATPFIVCCLVASAERKGILPVSRKWLLEHYPKPVSSNTITAALRQLTTPSCGLALRVKGGWTLSPAASRSPFIRLLLEKRATSAKRSQGARNVAVVVAAPLIKNHSSITTTTLTTDPKELARRAQLLDVLHEVGIWGTKAEQLAERQDITPDDIRAHMEAALKGKWDNPQGFVIRLIESGAPAPKPRDPNYDRYKYIMGEFAEYVHH